NQIRDRIKALGFSGVHWLPACSGDFAMTTLFEQILQDLRCGWRVHCASGKSTAVIVLTLGVAIAAASTVFGFVDAVLLRPPAVPHPEDLLVITDTNGVTTRPRLFSFSDVGDLSEALRGSMDVTALTT